MPVAGAEAPILASVTRAFDWPFPEPERIGEMAVLIAITLFVAWLIQQAMFLLVGRTERLMQRAGGAGPYGAQRTNTLGQILRNLVTVVVLGTAAIRVVDILGWDVQPFLAGAGILGVALGFGAQSLVRDVIAGVFILMEDQYAVGDLVEVNGKAATVEKVSVRATVLRDFNGYLYFVPNGEMKVIVNRSRGWNRHAVDVQVSASEDVDATLDVCRRVAEALNADVRWSPRLLDPVEVWGVESLAGGEVQIRTVVRTRPGPDGPETTRELRRRLQRALAQAGIRIGSSREVVIQSDVAAQPSKGT